MTKVERFNLKQQVKAVAQRYLIIQILFCISFLLPAFFFFLKNFSGVKDPHYFVYGLLPVYTLIQTFVFLKNVNRISKKIEESKNLSVEETISIPEIKKFFD